MRKVLCCLAAAVTIVLTMPTVHAQERADREEELADQEQELYEQATDAIDDQEWSHAARDFARVADMKKAHAGAALYWLAYARNKMGMRPEAIAALQQLKQNYPKSKWTNDAEKLELEIRQGAGQKIEPDKVADEDLKLIVLNGLMQSDPDRALPVLGEMLQSGKSTKLRDRALFIISQSSSPQAYDILSRAARNNADPDLQRRAVKYLGVMGSARNRKILGEVYGTATDIELKKSILKAYMIAGDRADLLVAAKSETNPELRAEAVSQLGLLGARDELAQLYASEPSVEVRKKIIQAMFLGGGSEKLYDIARNEPNLELKVAAIRNLGLLGGAKTGDFLVSLYDADTRAEVRRAVINSLFIQSNAGALVGLARRETNPELKKEVISRLSLMHSKEAVDYLMEYLKQ